MFVCNYCGKTFKEPRIKRYWENLDGENGWERVCEEHCPYCGDEEIEALPEELSGDDDLYAPEPDWVETRREWEELHG